MLSGRMECRHSPFFCFPEKIERMKCMKFHERLWCSISFLVGAVLAVMALVFEPWRSPAAGRGLCGVVHLACRHAAPSASAGPEKPGVCRPEEPSKRGSLRAADGGCTGTACELPHLGLSSRHVPGGEVGVGDTGTCAADAHGGKGLIRVQGVPGYNYAQVQLDPSGTDPVLPGPHRPVPDADRAGRVAATGAGRNCGPTGVV